MKTLAPINYKRGFINRLSVHFMVVLWIIVLCLITNNFFIVIEV